MATTSEITALDRLLESLSRCLNSESARQIADLRADDELQARLDELADKSTEGLLTESERTEYETYVRAINFITVLQAKARTMLSQANKS